LSALESCCKDTKGCSGFNTNGIMKAADCEDHIDYTWSGDLYILKDLWKRLWKRLHHKSLDDLAKELWQENHCNLTLYLEINPDVPRDEHKAKSHYRMSGHGQGRICDRDLWQENHCNLTLYLDSNPDVPRDEQKAKSHYRMSGHGEGRNCNKPCLSRYSYELPPLRPPSPSKSGNILNVLVPIRNREEHLRAFIPAFSKSMQHNAINAKVFVIEQVGDGLWNKGQLFNIGFAQALAKGLADRRSNWLFTDVDVFELQPGRLAYSVCVKPGLAKVQHLYGIGATDEVPWRSDYGNSVLGGVFCMATKLFVDVNGFSNEYWGWGFEDLDFEQRIRTAAVDPSVKVGRLSRGHALKHVVQRGSLVPRLGARGDCLNALGIADLPTPVNQRLGDVAKHAYNLMKNPGVRIQKLHEDTYNSSDWRKQLQADGMRALREDANFSLVGEGFIHLSSEQWDAGSLEVHRLRVNLSLLCCTMKIKCIAMDISSCRRRHRGEPHACTGKPSGPAKSGAGFMYEAGAQYSWRGA
jgi:hypothetical protein